MKRPEAFPPSDRSRSNRRGLALAPRPLPLAREQAFTMVEIALSLAIIGFALVAILGVLPTGLQVQRENREETIISQDATVWLNAIRNGARGYDDLTNSVDAVLRVETAFDINGNIQSGYPQVHLLTPTNYFINGTPQPPTFPNNIYDGYRIIGMLSVPKFTYHAPSPHYDITNRVIATSNYVTAYVRAMSGAATEKFPQDNSDVRELGFRYRMISEVVPYSGWDWNWVQFDPTKSATNSFDRQVRDSAIVAGTTSRNLNDIRLVFRWPLLPNGTTGNGRQAFRAEAGGELVRTNDRGMTVFFLNPRTYVRYP
jgi:type II secretory pathway pseudopilin PulG